MIKNRLIFYSICFLFFCENSICIALEFTKDETEMFLRFEKEVAQIPNIEGRINNLKSEFNDEKPNVSFLSKYPTGITSRQLFSNPAISEYLKKYPVTNSEVAQLELGKIYIGLKQYENAIIILKLLVEKCSEKYKFTEGVPYLRHFERPEVEASILIILCYKKIGSDDKYFEEAQKFLDHYPKRNDSFWLQKELVRDFCVSNLHTRARDSIKRRLSLSDSKLEKEYLNSELNRIKKFIDQE